MLKWSNLTLTLLPLITALEMPTMHDKQVVGDGVGFPTAG